MKKPLLLAIAVACAVGVQVSWGQSPKSPPTASPAAIAAFQAEEKSRDWRNAPWTESETPYLKIRQQVNAAIKQGQKPAEMLRRYEPKGADMNKAEPLYRWAYIAYRGFLLSPSQDARAVNATLRPLAYMDRNRRPQSYSWARLRFLLTTLSPVYNPKELRNVAFRLYKRDPKDVQVRYKLIGILPLTANKEDNLRAIRMAQEEVKRSPKNVTWQRSLAFAYKSAWMRDYQASYALQTKQQYVRLLSMYPVRSEDWIETRRILVDLDVSTNADGTYRKTTIAEYRAALKKAGVDY